MSIQFNDTTNLKGLVQIYEDEIGVEPGFISGNAVRLKKFTAEVNMALDDYFAIALPASGTWQLDDSGHTKYPIIYADIVDGQRDYNFTTDEQGNLVLDIYKVAILPSATATLFEEIKSVDVQSEGDGGDILTENTAEGVPYVYDKTANGIFLDPIPAYNATDGLKVYINREASYFTSSDTTKKPGVPGLHHKYFALKPALDYARRNNLINYNKIREEVVSLEGDEEKGITGSIVKYFSRRERDVRDVLQGEPISYK